MPTDATLKNIRVKIDRARQHIESASSFIKSYLDTRPFGIATRRDENTRRLVYFVDNVQEPDTHLSGIVGDALHNLRSCLDHMAYQLVFNGTGLKPSRRVYFPICDDQAKYETDGHRQIEGAKPDAIAVIDTIRPYKAGNERLWQLHRLNNVDKHRLLLMVGSAFQGVNIAEVLRRGMQETLSGEKRVAEMFGAIKMPDLFLKPADNLFPLRPGVDLFIDAPDAEPSTRVTFRFEVSFGEPEVMNGESIVPTLNEMASVVDQVLNQLAPHL